MEERDRLPVHPVPPGIAEAAAHPDLGIDGLVAHPGTLPGDRLAALPRHELAEPFTCEEGWTVPGLRWGGVRLLDVLALARPLPEARYVRVCAGSFAYPLELAAAETALLADELDGAPLPLEHGAPWRLVLPGGACYASVKWVDRLELTRDSGPSTAEQIARSRLADRS